MAQAREGHASRLLVLLLVVTVQICVVAVEEPELNGGLDAIGVGATERGVADEAVEMLQEFVSQAPPPMVPEGQPVAPPGGGSSSSSGGGCSG